ncbi:DNA dC-_dU-editing enzyme APOBEC-3G-like [Canis lupus familiaris]|nr:DNA dC->dU-editing enzyme APOBEC-3G-like [Canis lupus familiaris]
MSQSYDPNTSPCVSAEGLALGLVEVATPAWSGNPSVPLLCQGGGGQHAEWFLLEHIRSRNLDQKLSYKVTCFLSWTPCEKCAEEIIRFLAKNRHVSLSILASRIYTMGPYVKGLRELYDAGVHISIMTFRDFEYCWQTFVDHQDSPFQPWADLDRRSQQLSQQLRAILQKEPEGWTSVCL